MFRIWRHMLEFALNVPDLPTVLEFCERLLERQINLYEEYKLQFVNIYRTRVRDYFKNAPPKQTKVNSEEAKRR